MVCNSCKTSHNVLSRLSQSRSLGFLVWCGRTRHELSLARASRSQSRYALKSSTCEQVYVLSNSHDCHNLWAEEGGVGVSRLLTFGGAGW